MYYKEYYQEHKEEIKAKRRARYAKNPDYQKEYNKEHADYYNEQAKKYAKTHQDEYRTYQKLYKQNYPNRNPYLDKKIKEERGYKCEMCGFVGDSKTIHAHHIIPLLQGGQNTRENIQCLCEDCHNKAHGKQSRI